MEPETLLTKMVEIESITKNEKELGEFLVKYCHTQNIQAHLDEVGNFIAEIGTPGAHPAVLLFGHMDTVAPYLPVKKDITQDILYGRGSVDAKGPLATFIQSMINLRDSIQGYLVVVGAVQEEGRSVGAHFFKKTDYITNIDYGIIGEPSNTTNITIGYRGSMVLKLVIKTEPGHASSPDVRNAIEDFLTLHNIFLERLPNINAQGKHRKLTIRPTWIEAHSADKAVIYYNIRIPHGMTTTQLLQQIEEIITEFNKEPNFAKITLEVRDRNDPYVISDKKSSLITLFRKGIEEETGEPPRLIKKTGTADLNVLGNEHPHIPMFAYGPGDSRLDHTNEEHIYFSDLHKAIRIMTQVLQDFLC
jgi:LysW-gamma-L-lysine carboxypeptidase